MSSRLLRNLLIVLCTILAMPGVGLAQEAVLSGTVVDSTGGVLPGVTVKAVHEASGNTFEAVTDERGIFRLPARIGTYQITTELQGFQTMTRSGVQLLVGQNVVLSLQMNPSTVTESVTVTGEAPLLEVSQSSLGGNIDSKQMEELPVQGRGWTTLALLAPGNRTTAIGATPVQDRNDNEVREFQLNMDGQQISSQLGTGNQPLYSRDSIAEFQFISNRFDATQGRSSGVQVNAVTKSGTNRYAGSVSGYFRDDQFNAKDHVLDRVVPYSNQQISTTVGGPIVRDKVHFFGNYEYEREPRASIWNTRYPEFNITLEGPATRKMGGARVDYQLSPQMRLMGKGHAAVRWDPFGAANSNHPAGTNTNEEINREFLGQLTQVISNRALNEIKGGYAKFQLSNANLTTWSLGPQQGPTRGLGGPRIRFQGFQVPGNANHPRVRYQENWMVRDDFTYSFDARGRHDLKMGGEFIFYHELTQNCRNCNPVIDAANTPPPDNLPELLPDAFNADTWNIDALVPGIRRYTVGVGNFDVLFDQQRYATWFQDDWKASDRLTINMGLRYDLVNNGFANDAAFAPWVVAGRPNDTNNIQPRFGFAYQLNDRTVIRGGSGIYYGDALSGDSNWMYGNSQIATIQLTNDQRSDFASNPFNSQPVPNYEQAQERFCHVNGNAPGCLIAAAQELAPPEGDYAQLSRSWQNSIGFQRQVGDHLAFEADYVYSRSKYEKQVQQNINILFDPATGVNLPFSERENRFNPDFGVVSMSLHSGRTNYHGLQMAMTKRFSDNWQASATYTLSELNNATGQPISGLAVVPFTVAPDLGNEYGLAISDQRHRMVFNGIYQMPWEIQLSGLYFFGSGERHQTSFGGDERDLGTDAENRLRPDGTIVPRNNLVGDQVHRVDVRLQKRVRLFGNASVDGIVEVFNLFDRGNFGTYITEESDPDYGQPDVNNNIAYGPRVVQFGFRFVF